MSRLLRRDDVEFNFSGKRALVTGASRGIGRGVAVALAKSGAQVFALSRSKDDLDALCAEQSGITAVVCDLSDWERTREAVKAILPIQLLVNNAGLINSESFFAITEKSFNELHTVNVIAALNVTQVVAEDLVRRGEKGSVVNISSMAGHKGMTNTTTYCTTKAALEALTRSMARELGPNGIRTNSVVPHVVKTEMAMQYFGPNLEKTQSFVDRTPLGRTSIIDEVVAPTLFLLSDGASMINGTFADCSGGFLTSGP